MKRFIAGIWGDDSAFNGFTFHTSLIIDGALAFTKNKTPIHAELQSDKHTVQVIFPKAINPEEKYVVELQLLLNRKATIKQLGKLNIIDWPKEDLSEIIFLRKAGKIFFSSVLAKIKYNQLDHTRSIVPTAFARTLTSHARKASAIRVEWGQIPTIKLTFKYTIVNSGNQTATNIDLKAYLPPNTKFQQTSILSTSEIEIRTDEDENSLLFKHIPYVSPQSSISFEIPLEITPVGNVGVLRPFFGSYHDYQEITREGSIGEAMIQASKYWPIQTEEVQKLVQVLQKNSKNLSKYIMLAFEFVNQKILYQINHQRVDALSTIQNRTGDCSEMSDLFVALLRAAHIPAKIVHGWTIDLDTLSLNPHAWCEFFSSRAGGWRQCDPTWGYLTGVSSQHICRQREGIISDQHTYFWKYEGNTQVNIKEEVIVQAIK